MGTGGWRVSCEDLGSVISRRSQRRVVGLLVLAGVGELGDCRGRGARMEVGAARTERSDWALALR